MTALEIIGQDDLFSRVRPAEAVEALLAALADGFDPAEDLPRTRYDVAGGELMLMPATTSRFFGVKVLSLADDATQRGIPLIQGSYLLFDAATMAPTAVIDGAALTALRTPAVSLAGVKHLLVASREPLTAVIMGTGLQARHHEATLRDVLSGAREVEVTYVGRTKPTDLEAWCESGSAAAEAALKKAELVITATAATAPIVSAAQLREDAIVVAMGAHTADTRELAGDVFEGATVIVEDIAVALREAGDVVQAIEEGFICRTDLVGLKDAVRMQTERQGVERSGRVVFKTTGMPWEDVVVASSALAGPATT